MAMNEGARPSSGLPRSLRGNVSWSTSNRSRRSHAGETVGSDRLMSEFDA